MSSVILKAWLFRPSPTESEQIVSKPKILVAGATGKTGSSVVAQLRQRDFAVRAVVRSEDARSERLARLGAEIVVADLFDFEQLVGAMRGVQRAYYCPPFHPYMVHSAMAFAVAAREARLESIVGLSHGLRALRTRHYRRATIGSPIAFSR